MRCRFTSAARFEPHRGMLAGPLNECRFKMRAPAIASAANNGKGCFGPKAVTVLNSICNSPRLPLHDSQQLVRNSEALHTPISAQQGQRQVERRVKSRQNSKYDLPGQLLVDNPIDHYLINSPLLPKLKRARIAASLPMFSATAPAKAGRKTGSLRLQAHS